MRYLALNWCNHKQNWRRLHSWRKPYCCGEKGTSLPHSMILWKQPVRLSYWVSSCSLHYCRIDWQSRCWSGSWWLSNDALHHSSISGRCRYCFVFRCFSFHAKVFPKEAFEIMPALGLVRSWKGRDAAEGPNKDSLSSSKEELSSLELDLEKVSCIDRKKKSRSWQKRSFKSPSNYLRPFEPLSVDRSIHCRVYSDGWREEVHMSVIRSPEVRWMCSSLSDLSCLSFLKGKLIIELELTQAFKIRLMKST